MARMGAKVNATLSTPKDSDHLVVLGEAILLEEGCSWCYDRAVVVNELVVVACQAKEAAHRSRQARNRPVVNGLHLGQIHGYTYL